MTSLEGSKPYGACSNVASSIPSCKLSGGEGLCSDLPLTTWNSPVGNKNTLSTLGRYQSKSHLKSLATLGISNKVADGLPAVGNVLCLKSNVAAFTYAGEATDPVPVNKFLTPGLKSKKSGKNFS